MATKRNGTQSWTARAALAVMATLMAACAVSPTEPEFAQIDRWDGEPVVETAKLRADTTSIRP